MKKKKKKQKKVVSIDGPKWLQTNVSSYVDFKQIFIDWIEIILFIIYCSDSYLQSTIIRIGITKMEKFSANEALKIKIWKECPTSSSTSSSASYSDVIYCAILDHYLLLLHTGTGTGTGTTHSASVFNHNFHSSFFSPLNFSSSRSLASSN